MKTPYSELPQWLRLRLGSALRLWKSIDWSKVYLRGDQFDVEDERCLTTITQSAEAVSSRFRVTGDGYDHLVLIDLDVPAALVPSSTSGHGHLYIDTEVRWEDYLALLRAMRKCGIVEEGFVRATEERGEAFLRLPWIRKGLEQQDARDALETWLDEESA